MKAFKLKIRIVRDCVRVERRRRAASGVAMGVASELLNKCPSKMQIEIHSMGLCLVAMSRMSVVVGSDM